MDLRTAAISLAFAAGALLAARAADLGMQAPPLRISNWTKGSPIDVTSGRGTNVYVVEFWATWCGPCRVTIPHLTALQKRFKDRNVTVIGISRETTAKVRPFVEKQGATMAYTVAVDDADRTTAAYMQAFGVGGIPHAFVIDKQGRIAWHGHPMDGLDRVLEEVVADRYDINSAAQTAGLTAAMNGYFQKVVASGTQSARDDGDRVVRDAGKHPDLLNEFAWIILTHPRLPARDVELATLAAKAACDGTQNGNAGFLDTYARALSMSGKHTEAVNWQRKAIAAETDAGSRAKLEGTLQEYQAKVQ